MAIPVKLRTTTTQMIIRSLAFGRRQQYWRNRTGQNTENILPHSQASIFCRRDPVQNVQPARRQAAPAAGKILLVSHCSINCDCCCFFEPKTQFELFQCDRVAFEYSRAF